MKSESILVIHHAISNHTYSYANACGRYVSQKVDILGSRNNFWQWETYHNGDEYLYDAVATGKHPIVTLLLTWYRLTAAFLKLGKYSAVEFHMSGIEYLPLFFLYRLKALRVGVVFYGDDWRKRRPLYTFCLKLFSKMAKPYIVNGNASYCTQMKQVLGTQNVHNIAFGSDTQERLVATQLSKRQALEMLKVPTGKVVITCCHNASNSLNQMQIVEHLLPLPIEVQSKMHLVFMLTYPTNQALELSLRTALEGTHFSTTFATALLTVEELLPYRVASDAFLHFQSADSFSTSMIEYLYTENIVVVGSWLDYSNFEQSGGKLWYSTWANLTDLLGQIATDFMSFKLQCANNSAVILASKSWASNLRNWAVLWHGAEHY